MQTPGLQRSTRAKYPVERLRYDSLAACQFMCMANVMQDVEPTCFDEAVGAKEWDAAMNDELDALDDSEWYMGVDTVA